MFIRAGRTADNLGKLNPAFSKDGTAPITTSKKCKEKAFWSASDLDLAESNEAFGARQKSHEPDKKRPEFPAFSC